MTVTYLGIDIAKNVFQLHGADRRNKSVLRKRLRHSELMPLIAKLNSCTIGIEACTGAF